MGSTFACICTTRIIFLTVPALTSRAKNYATSNRGGKVSKLVCTVFRNREWQNCRTVLQAFWESLPSGADRFSPQCTVCSQLYLRFWIYEVWLRAVRIFSAPCDRLRTNGEWAGVTTTRVGTYTLIRGSVRTSLLIIFIRESEFIQLTGPASSGHTLSTWAQVPSGSGKVRLRGGITSYNLRTWAD